MTQPRLRLVHASGRFNRSAASLLTAVRTYTTLANIITLTEIRDTKRAAALRLVTGWRRVYDGKGDCAILIRRFTWAVEASSAIELSTPIPRPNWAQTATLRHRRRKTRIDVLVAHLPAHSTIGCKWAHDDNAIAYQQSVSTLRRWVNTPGDTDGMVIAGDLNVNMFRACWRTYYAEKLRVLPLCWNKNTLPNEGTHGRTLLDAALADLKLLSAEVLPYNPSSDHAPIRLVYRLP